jgi:hypothetical protein
LFPGVARHPSDGGCQTPISQRKGWAEHCVWNPFTIKLLLEFAGPRMGAPSEGPLTKSQVMSQRRVPANPPGGLFPFVCCNCRRSFKRPSNGFRPRPCPLCGQPAQWVHLKFKAPKATDVAQWEKVRVLIEHGFLFHTFSDGRGHKVRYPKTLEEARTWVKQWSDNAIRVATQPKPCT